MTTCAECMTNPATLCPDCAHKIVVGEIAQFLRKSEALQYAIQIIEAYQLEIRNSDRLEGTGFCQGVIFMNALDRIKDIAAGKVQEGTTCRVYRGWHSDDCGCVTEEEKC